MKVSIIAILMSISAMCFSQTAPETVIQFDTITTTESSKKALGEFVTRMQELAPKYDEAKRITTEYETIGQQIMLIVSALIDPKEFAGLTEKNDILKKK